MAITGNASYVSTSDEFIAHWDDVNTVLGAGGPLKLGVGGAIVRATLVTKLAALEAQRTVVSDEQMDHEVKRGEVEDLKALLLDRFSQLAGKVRADFEGKPFERSLPKNPGVSSGEGFFLKTMASINRLWAKIGTAGTVIELAGGYAQTDFADDVAALRTAFKDLAELATDLSVDRQERDDIQDAIYPILKAYRQAVPSVFPAGHAMIESLPRLTPPPGATPQPPNLSGTWDAVAVKAHLTGTASVTPAVVKHQLRAVAGPEYNAADEDIVATVNVGGSLVFETDQFLNTPGVTASFRLYAITDTDHEAASGTVKVTRPA